MKALLISAVAAGAILTSTAQAGRSFVYDAELGTVARESLWRSVTPTISRAQVKRLSVRCYRDRRSFERTFEGRYGLPARGVIAYYAGGADVHLRNTTCDNVHAFLAGRHTVYTAAAYAILLHEALHLQAFATRGSRRASRATQFAGARSGSASTNLRHSARATSR